MSKSKSRTPVEVAVIGEVDDWEEDVVKALLEVPLRGECALYIDSCGGSVYGALAIVTLLRYRQLDATAIVLGECSSAALMVFAACRRRFVTPYSTLLFHRMRSESEKRIASHEALNWAKHFGDFEKNMDELQIHLFGSSQDQLRQWTVAGQFVTGPQMVEAGLAEMLEL
jgi:ATP-dependent protease ClpP protease subunit